MFGVPLSGIGNEAQKGTQRWTFDEIYLWDGIEIQALPFGLFTLPELLNMAIAQASLSGAPAITRALDRKSTRLNSSH